MTWQPAARPEWVDSLNRGGSDPQPSDITDLVGLDRAEPWQFTTEALQADRLLTEALLAEAAAPGDLDAFGSAQFLQPFRMVTHELCTSARLTPLGCWATHRYLVRLLRVRLQLEALAHRHPELSDHHPTAPIFVIGAPRTGTTVVHRLLAMHPRLRAPLGWELLWPVGSTGDERVDLAGRELTLPQSIAGQLRSIHTYSATMTKECLSAMSFAFRSEEFISRYHVPAYSDWLARCDMAPAYRMHRMVLSALELASTASGTDNEGTRWVLKSPVHLQSIPTLLATYPHARFVVTHRHPAEVLASVSSLVATLRSAFTDHVDAEAIGAYHLELYARSLDDLVGHVDGGPLAGDRAIHVTHAAVIDDAPALVRDLWNQLDLPPGGDTLDVEHSAPRHDSLGAHRYNDADFGLDRAEIDRRFGRYLDRFGFG